MTKTKKKFSVNSFFKNLNKKNIIITTCIFITSILHIIWSLTSPDAQAYYITAKNIINSESPIIYSSYFNLSENFIRQQFIRYTNNSVIFIYPIGSSIILAWSIFLFQNFFWLFFPFFMIININIIERIYYKYNDEHMNIFSKILILFQPLIFIPFISGISIDLLSCTFFIFLYDLLLEIHIRNRIFNDKFNIFSVLLSAITIALIKFNVFVYSMLLIFISVLSIIYKNKDKIKITSKNKVFLAIITLTFLLICSFFTIKFFLSSISFSHIIKAHINNLYYSFKLFAINIVQILVLTPLLFIFTYKDFIAIKKKKPRIQNWISIIINIFFILMIFFWRSYTLYPFDIGGRYYLPILMIQFYHKLDRKKIRTFLLISLFLTTSFTIHAKMIDRKNNEFIQQIYENTSKNSIIVTSYYFKLIIYRTVYLYEYKNHPLFPPETLRENVTSDIEKLLKLNYTLYLIPDGKLENVNYLLNYFNATKIFEIPPIKIFGINVDYQHKRALYSLNNYNTTLNL
ncbi:MAG: hypothetical protein ACTSRP_09480 [Candidatus Helarchaeota archaeon]